MSTDTANYIILVDNVTYELTLILEIQTNDVLCK